MARQEKGSQQDQNRTPGQPEGERDGKDADAKNAGKDPSERTVPGPRDATRMDEGAGEKFDVMPDVDVRDRDESYHRIAPSEDEQDD